MKAPLAAKLSLVVATAGCFTAFAGEPAVTQSCLPGKAALLQARLSGSIATELNWRGAGVSCSGAARPNQTGLRLQFRGTYGPHHEPLALVFGLTGIKEGQGAHAVPANLTVIREGAGEFYGTQGDDKCTVDELRQEPLTRAPFRERAYKVTARGFCTEPARAVRGNGAVLMTRFDFVGRVDYTTEDMNEKSAHP